MKKILLLAATAALAITASAQTETRGRPGVVVTKATTTPALQTDMKNRGMEMTLERIKQALDGHLSAAIVGSRKFTVLVRNEDFQKLDDPTQMLKALNLRENDYSVLIKLDSYLDTKETMAMDGKTLVKRRFQLSGQVMIVGGETAEVLDMSNLQIEKTDIVQTTVGQGADRLDEMLPLMTRDFAEQSYERLMGVAFPMRVLDAEDGVITINRGADFLNVNDRVEIFGKGRTIVDEDTGEELKIKGRSLGFATITSTEPNYSQAKANGTFDVPNGAEVRKLQK